MTFARQIGEEFVAHWRMLAKASTWKAVPGRDYQTCFIDPPEGCKSAFFIKLPPGGKMHKHVDAGDTETHHVVIQTNEHCLNWWTDEAGDHAVHMDEGKRYVVDRTLMHWAENNGETDRIHLLLER